MTPARVFTLALPRGQRQLVTARTESELLDILCAHYPWAQALAGTWAVWEPCSLLFERGPSYEFIQEVKA